MKVNRSYVTYFFIHYFIGHLFLLSIFTLNIKNYYLQGVTNEFNNEFVEQVTISIPLHLKTTGFTY